MSGDFEMFQMAESCIFGEGENRRLRSRWQHRMFGTYRKVWVEGLVSSYNELILLAISSHWRCQLEFHQIQSHLADGGLTVMTHLTNKKLKKILTLFENNSKCRI